VELMSAVNHAVFVFIVAALIAILLNPIVRAFMRCGSPGRWPCSWSTACSPSPCRHSP
jgi:predicted PurR-regulated permease PerM